MPAPPLTADEEQILAEALLLWRYVGHCTGKRNGVPDTNSETRAHIALKLAKRLRVFGTYWQVMQATDVLSVRVRNLDTEPVPHGQRGRKNGSKNLHHRPRR